MDENVISVLTTVTNKPAVPRAIMPVDRALIEMLNRFGSVNMELLEKQTGLRCAQIAEKLNGAILQDPEPFDRDGAMYDPYAYWTVSANYLSGNIPHKLKVAKRVNRKFEGVFDRNIEALAKVCPPKIHIDEIYIHLGMHCPEKVIELFCNKLFHAKRSIRVDYIESEGRFVINIPAEISLSEINNKTYGVQEIRNNRTIQYLKGTDIIEAMINGKTPEVYDNKWKGYSVNGSYTYDRTLNVDKTAEAQQKSELLDKAFRDFVCSDKEITDMVENYYNDTVVGYTAQTYDGTFLTLPDINPKVNLYEHQRNAVARVLLSGYNTLLAHDVGTGKTYEMLVSAHELHRMGLSKKILIAVPNNILQSFIDAYRYLYPEDRNFLAVYPKDFSPKNRNKVLSKITKGNYTFTIMAHSTFDMIKMSKQYYINKMSKEITRLENEAKNALFYSTKKLISSKAAQLSKELLKYIENEPESEYIPFDDLGIDTLMIDEAHNYKNVGIKTRSKNIIGISSQGSEKCKNMLEKVRSVSRVVFDTATLIINSLSDPFVFQYYLQYDVLKLNGLDNFDIWINTFGSKETYPELNVDCNAKNYHMVTRISTFHNIGELMGMFSLICDYYTSETKEGLPEYDGPTNVLVPKSETLKTYIDSLSKRNEACHLKLVKPTQDNPLKITVDGRMAALYLPLVIDSVDKEDLGYTKIDACAEKIMSVHKAHPDSAQMVICDIGTPKARVNVYDELRKKLILLGMDSENIAFIHDATTEKARTKLFADMNSGKLKVVIGSTQKLGIGVNVQEKLVALHLLSVPWRPADMIQSEGRILRPGNNSEEVFVFRYITEGSFDAYSWQLLESKQKFICSFLSGISGERSVSNIVDTVLSYAEVKALAIGNPLIKKRFETANSLERCKIAFRNRQKQLIELRTTVKVLPNKIREFDRQAVVAGADYGYYTQMKMSINNIERTAFGEELIIALSDNVHKPNERLFDEYQGFYIMLPANMTEERPYILIRSVNGGEYFCEMPLSKTPLGCNKTVDYLLDHLNERQEELIRKKEISCIQLNDALSDSAKGNPYFEQVEVLKKELEKIDKQLEEDAKEDTAV